VWVVSGSLLVSLYVATFDLLTADSSVPNRLGPFLVFFPKPVERAPQLLSPNQAAAQI